MNKKAFTLAEVLIVLAIIGAIAALVIPNIADSYTEEKTVIKVRKVYNDIDLAYNNAISKYGPVTSWGETNLEKIPLMMNSLGNKCSSDTSGNCYPLDATQGTNSSYYKYELDDNVSLAINANDTTKKFTIYAALDGSRSTVSAGINLFGFNLSYSDGLSPMGMTYDRNASNGYSAGTSLNSTNWVYHKGNMEYINCASSLNWKTKFTCD